MTKLRHEDMAGADLLTPRGVASNDMADQDPIPSPAPAVRQLRVVLEVDDIDAALAVYHHALGLPEQAAFSGDGDARVSILDAGRATLELANPAQRRMIDQVEVGRVLDPAVRIAFEVDDTAATVAALVDAGATALSPPVETPWRSLNARLAGPESQPITIFQELEPLDQRAAREGFGTATTTEAPMPDQVYDVHLREAVRLAVVNAQAGQRPYAAVLVRDGEVLATGVNTAHADDDPTAHAEIAAIREACRRLGSQDLTGATMVASCEPCAMCHTACATVGIHDVVYAAPKELAPAPEGPDRAVARAMQAALRQLRPDEIRHVPTPGAELPFRQSPA
ncbi:MAG TPA: deaminase [Euzebya sp.]|nr:deaminase [Euzebya sp.]